MKLSLIPLDIDYLIEKANSGERTKSGKNIKCAVIRARRILKILKRDKFKCVVCGMGDLKKLTIDHINGRKFAKWNNQQKYKIDKCQTMCVDCHIEKNEKCAENGLECEYAETTDEVKVDLTKK